MVYPRGGTRRFKFSSNSTNMLTQEIVSLHVQKVLVSHPFFFCLGHSELAACSKESLHYVAVPDFHLTARVLCMGSNTLATKQRKEREGPCCASVMSRLYWRNNTQDVHPGFVQSSQLDHPLEQRALNTEELDSWHCWLYFWLHTTLYRLYTFHRVHFSSKTTWCELTDTQWL